ncbi:MAG: flagellar motor switch protein FliN [Pirellulaceae bacterium]|jgi:flagellar motor switch protein FliN/FliY|nr:flagellar motor switch protein FliN [Pirellulaceae bacterium]
MTDAAENLGHEEVEQILREAAVGPPRATASGSGPEPGPGTARTKAAHATEASAIASSGPIDEDVQFLLAQAEQAIRSVDEPQHNPVPHLERFELKDLTTAPASTERASLDLLRDVELDLRIELGRTAMYLEDVLQLRRGSVVPLDKLAGDPVDVYVNGRLVARGEVLVLNDNFCVRIAELIAGDE